MCKYRILGATYTTNRGFVFVLIRIYGGEVPAVLGLPGVRTGGKTSSW